MAFFFATKKASAYWCFLWNSLFLNSWKEVKIYKNNIEARTFIHSTYWPREYIVNIIWKLEYWRVNYHPPKGRWLLGSHRLPFKKFGILSFHLNTQATLILTGVSTSPLLYRILRSTTLLLFTLALNVIGRLYPTTQKVVGFTPHFYKKSVFPHQRRLPGQSRITDIQPGFTQNRPP